MTRAGATWATAATILLGSVALFGLGWLLVTPAFWWVVMWIVIGCATVFVLLCAGAAVVEIWEWFRRDGWRANCTGCGFTQRECRQARRQGFVACCPDCRHTGAGADSAGAEPK